MSIWDSISSGLNRFADKLDGISDTSKTEDSTFDLMDKEYCWEELDYAGNYTLQRHVVSGQCRIVDRYGTVVERGTQQQLEQSMVTRSAQAAAEAAYAPAYAQSINDRRPDSWRSLAPVQAQYGDIIGVVRRGGTYTHYGIYLSDTCVVHYSIPASKTIGYPTIHPTSLPLFLGSGTEYFVLDFPKPYVPPVIVGNEPPHDETVTENIARSLQQHYGYHLYTPEETVQRAKSRIGETHYNLLTNNCEHFAIWCKTGVSESMQVSEMLHSLKNAAGFSFLKPFRR